MCVIFSVDSHLLLNESVCCQVTYLLCCIRYVGFNAGLVAYQTWIDTVKLLAVSLVNCRSCVYFMHTFLLHTVTSVLLTGYERNVVSIFPTLRPYWSGF